MRKRVGDAVADAYRCFSPPVDDLSAYVDSGRRRPKGVPVRVFRPVAEADLRDPDRLGAAAPAGGIRRWVQADLPGDEPPLDARGLAPAGALARRRRPAARRRRRRTTRCGGRSAAAAGVARALLLGQPPARRAGAGARGCAAGHPDAVQDRLAAEARRRFQAPERRPADLVVAGNHPWPGDPMQSFKVLLQHRAASRPGGVLVGFFWTDPDEIDRSFPMPALRTIAATGALGGWAIRRALALAERTASAVGSPARVHAPLGARAGGRSDGPGLRPPAPRAARPPARARSALFADQDRLWRAAAEALGDTLIPRIRVFPQGGLTYAPAAPGVVPTDGTV